MGQGKGVHTFPEGISPKVNVIGRLGLTQSSYYVAEKCTSCVIYGGMHDVYGETFFKSRNV